MALFKIFRGPAASLNNQKITEGYAYFTPDDGKFYIDTATKRVPLNAQYADLLTGAPVITFVKADGDDEKASCIKLEVGGQSYIKELPYASSDHSGVLSLVAQEIYGVKTFMSSPVLSAGVTLSSGQAIKDNAGKAILSLVESTNPQAGDLYLYTSGANNLYHNGSSILTTSNFLTNCQTAMDNLYVNIKGDTMSGPLTISTSDKDAYINIKNSSHGWQVKATSITRGIFDNKASQFIVYQTLSDTTNTLNIAQVPLAIASNLTASGTATFNGATTFANTVALNNKTTVASNTSLCFGGTTYYISGDGVANLKNIVANGTLKVTDATTLESTLAVTGTSSFTGAITAASTIESDGNISSEGIISAPYITASERLTSTKTAVIGSNHATQALTVTGGATFGETIIAKKAEIGASGATISGTTSAQNINPSKTSTYTLGTSSLKWSNIYADTVTATTFTGNAATATEFNSERTISLSGDVSGSAKSTGKNGWTISNMAIGTGKVTNAMLAGSIENAKLVNSQVTIAGNAISLGGSLSADTLRTSLGLANAMHYIGIATVAITNQSNTDPKISGYTWPDKRQAGDVIIYSGKEYVWNGTNAHWELLGDEGSYKVLQTAVTDPTASGNSSTFIDTISQDTNGKITVTKKNVQITVNAAGTGDGVVNITPTSGTNGVTYNVTHSKQGPASGYTSGNTVTTLSGAATSFSIPQISVDVYGHTALGADENITLTLPTSGSWFNNGFVTVNSSGISKLGAYLDFHATSKSSNAYDIRLVAASANANTVYLPSVNGYLLTRSGTTAVGGKKQPIYIDANGTATPFTDSEGTAAVPVFLNAGTLTACTASSLFSDFSSSPSATGETLSITVAGQSRTVALDAASTTQGGIVTTGTQSFAGSKTFTSNVTAPAFVGALTGNADTATQFASAAAVKLTGDVTGSASSQKGWSVATTLANSGVTAGKYGPSADASPAHGESFSVPYITFDAKGRAIAASTKTITLPTYTIGNATITIAAGDGLTSGTTGDSFTTNATSDKTITLNVGAGAGLTVSANSIGHSNSVTAATASGSATGTLTFGGTFTIPTVTYDAQGHITSKGTTTMTMPANPNTDTKVTAVGNHYTPSANSASELKASANSTTAATWGSTDLVTGVQIQRDAAGHVTGVSVSSIQMPANPNSNTTYTFGSGNTNGAFTVTPSNGTAQTVSIKGLGTAAYKAESYFALASHTHPWSQISDRATCTINTSGTITGSKVYGAVWNDYAEYRSTTEIVQAGQVVVENGNDTLSLATERLMSGANIVSDTFGFSIGETDVAKTPLAVSGRVLAYTYEDRDSYQPGDPVCSGPNGTVSKMTREEVMMYPDRIIGTVSAIPDYEIWGTGKIKVNGRIWIKVH